MNARSIRRAAERQALKSNRAAINRDNAQRSTGPITAEGKAKSSLNAVKTGLTGRTVLLPSENAAVYRAHLDSYFKELAPVGPLETALAQSLADTAWRLDRVAALEMNLYALGHLEFASHFDDHDPSERPGLIQLRTFLTYEKQLRNLQIQESRLRRQREKDMAELKALQQIRFAEESKTLISTPSPETDGFVFSTGASAQFIERTNLAPTVQHDPIAPAPDPSVTQAAA